MTRLDRARGDVQAVLQLQHAAAWDADEWRQAQATDRAANEQLLGELKSGQQDLQAALQRQYLDTAVELQELKDILHRFQRGQSSGNLAAAAAADPDDPQHYWEVYRREIRWEYDGVEDEEDEEGRPIKRKRELGAGSFGVVYAAAFRGRDVAVKVVSLPDDKIRQQFINEAELVSKLRHSHIAELVGGCIIGKKGYLLLLRLVCTLHEALYTTALQHQHLPDADACRRISVEIASAMHWLHTNPQCPIVHHDLKPSVSKL